MVLIFVALIAALPPTLAVAAAYRGQRLRQERTLASTGRIEVMVNGRLEQALQQIAANEKEIRELARLLASK